MRFFFPMRRGPDMGGMRGAFNIYTSSFLFFFCRGGNRSDFDWRPFFLKGIYFILLRGTKELLRGTKEVVPCPGTKKTKSN